MKIKHLILFRTVFHLNESYDHQFSFYLLRMTFRKKEKKEICHLNLKRVVLRMRQTCRIKKSSRKNVTC